MLVFGCELAGNSSPYLLRNSSSTDVKLLVVLAACSAAFLHSAASFSTSNFASASAAGWGQTASRARVQCLEADTAGVASPPLS